MRKRIATGIAAIALVVAAALGGSYFNGHGGKRAGWKWEAPTRVQAAAPSMTCGVPCWW